MVEEDLIVKKVEGDSGSNSMAINPKGSRINRLVLGGRHILGTFLRGGGEIGSTHLCTPLLGWEVATSYKIPTHGWVRNLPCWVARQGDDFIETTYPVYDVSYGASSYPLGVKGMARFTLKDRKFELLTVHENNGDKPAPLNTGVHFYFLANNWYGTKINGQDVASLIESETPQVISLDPINQIHIPTQAPLTLAQEGFSCAVLWVARDSRGECDPHYVCIEPVERNPLEASFGSEESLLYPTKFRRTKIVLSL